MKILLNISETGFSMSFESSWYIPERVIYIRLLSELDSAEEIETLLNRISELLQEGIAPVHVLLDDAKGGRPPLSLKQLKKRMEIVNNPIIGWVVGVGEVDAIAKFLIPLLMKIISVKYVRFGDIEQALKFLAERDTSLEVNV